MEEGQGVAGLTVCIGFEDDVTAREADQHTRDLMRQLWQLDIDRVDMARGAPRPGTRADAPTLLGAITLAGLSVKTVLPHIVTVTTAWLERSAQKSVTVEADGVKLEVKGGVKPEDVAAFLAMIEGGEAQGDKRRTSGPQDEGEDR
ncbi:hypothetical protein GCM10009799_28140 [Nocardiopsis rhodophaea]|uniref:Uncharacterized protein n=1 Tax=Nocardiopsis rhodophaea TaxID=280238 RepID=A0ABN2T5N2_9ACTN